jgi:hypothetical protein
MSAWVFFGIDAALAVFWLALAIPFVRQRWFGRAGVALTIAAVMIFCAWMNAGAVFGECAGTRGTTIPYHRGMTLCPGQSTVLELEIPIDPPAPVPSSSRGL